MDTQTFLFIAVLVVVVICLVCYIYKLWIKIKKWCRDREYQRFKSKFIRESLIGTFSQQLEDGHGDNRFAVLMLASTTSLWQLSKTKFERVRSSIFSYRDPLFDSSVPSYPHEIKDLKNYIVARADADKHPEMILLERYDELMLAYKEHYKQNASCVLLYSWQCPCVNCVDEIIKTFGVYRHKEMKIIIVYSKDSSPSTVSKLRSQNQRFEVIEVPYNPFSIRPRNSSLWNQCSIQ